jgi:hypothetical protein
VKPTPFAPLKGVGRNSRRGIKTPIDHAIAEIADRQHGNLPRGQLLAVGLSQNGIAHRNRVGRLHLVYRGVYAVGRPPRTALEWAAAAVLACGDGAALSHFSALALWGLAEWKWSGIHVTVPGDRRPKGIAVHRATGLLPCDLRVHAGLRMTSPARTLLDCAPNLTDKQLSRAVNDARRLLGMRPSHLDDVSRRFPRYPGARRLRPLLEIKGGPIRSEWEDAFPAWCDQHRLPPPTMNAIVVGYEVDALFPAERVIVELDSWEFHKDRGSFESDRERDAATLAVGHVTVRITWERMTAAEADRLRAILDARRRSA